MPKIAYLGPKGTYTHQAVIQQFPDETQVYAQKSIDDCFTSVDSGSVDYAVVPFENSTNGQVVFTCDLLRDWFLSSRTPQFRIVGEQFVVIHHCFMTRAADLSQITTVYSHPQVWTQVDGFTKTLPTHIQKVDTLSTSRAAEIVSQDETCTSACISAEICSTIYDLPLYKRNVENTSDNTTRFLILGRKETREVKDTQIRSTLPKEEAKEEIPKEEVSSKDTQITSRLPKEEKEETTPEEITSMMFTLDHNDPGALCDVLASFKKYNVNLNLIHSRPSHKEQWQYVFFVEASSSRDNMEKSIEEIKKKSVLAVMGSFERSWRYRRA